MSTNPYQSPREDGGSESPATELLVCPECGEPMEAGYVTTGARMYWRNWSDRSWLVWPSDGIAGTRASFVGSNKLTGFRCASCELVVFRYGTHKDVYAPGQER
jgi:hypothetical protein